jgi:hypothetical protein
MAIKTMTGTETGQNPYTRGWHTATISGVTEGKWNEKRYLDITFEGYQSSCNLRVYEQSNKETNEEFAIARLFKFANAGILSVLKDQTGNKPVIQYDDDINGLIGKKINIYVIDDKKNTKYARIWDRIAPAVQVGEHLSYSEDDVKYWKEQAEGAYAKYGKPTVTNGAVHSEPEPVTDNDMPF